MNVPFFRKRITYIRIKSSDLLTPSLKDTYKTRPGL